MIVKLFLRHPLHAKLYLLFRPDPINPSVGYLGSSNLTLSGLSRQGELNVDVMDHDACQKLARWFEDRWNDHWCVDISADLAEIIDESWAREELIPPVPHLRQDRIPPLAGSTGRLERISHPKGLWEQASRVSNRRSEDRGTPPEQARRRHDWRCGWPGQDPHGHRPGTGFRGRSWPPDLDHLPEEPRPDVGGLSGAISHAGSRPVDQPCNQRATRHAPLSARPH